MKLVMVGDVFPANVKYNEGIGVAARFRSHMGKPWERKLAPLLREADIAFANLEAPLVEDSDYAATHTFAGCKEFARFLANIGVNVVSVANNHILEQREEGFFKTLEYLEDSWIYWVGKQVKGVSNIKILQKKGVRVGFAAFNAIHDIVNPGLVADFHQRFVLDCIGRMKAAAVDICVVSLHWGREYVNVPSPSQVRLARGFIDAGADIIVGHHPHVVQPVEAYKGGLIFYSLGNFIFDILWSRNVRTGALAEVTLSSKGIEGYRLVPVFLERDFMPAPLEGRGLSRFLDRQRRYRAIIGAGEKRHRAYYRRASIVNRLWQRIAMKWHLLKNWRRLSPVARKQLGVNAVKKMARIHG